MKALTMVSLQILWLQEVDWLIISSTKNGSAAQSTATELSDIVAIRLSCTVAIYFTCPIYVTCDSLIILKHGSDDNTHTCTHMHFRSARNKKRNLSTKTRNVNDAARIDHRGDVAHRQCICLPKGSKKRNRNKHKKQLNKIDG